MTEENTERTLGRRRLLRRAGTVAAGVAGAGVVGAVAASPAQAAAGSFDSNSITAPALTVVNTATAEELGGPQVLLTPQAGSFGISPQAPAGSLAMDETGFLWIRNPEVVPGYPETTFVHTALSSTSLWPITPIRVLDSRNAPGRANVLNPSAIDASGRLKANTWLHLNLTGLVQWGYASVGTLTAAAPPGAGFLTIAPFTGDVPPKPSISSLNYSTGVSIATGVLAAHGQSGANTDVVSIYALTATAVLFDVTGFVVDSAGRISAGTASLGAGARASLDHFAARRTAVAKHAPQP